MISYPDFVNSITKEPRDIMANLGERHIGVLHAVLGISGESGELLDAVKKHVIYDKPLDYTNVVEELGDIMFYITMFCNEIGIELNEVISSNRAKLEKRYHEGKFSNAQAIARADKAA